MATKSKKTKAAPEPKVRQFEAQPHQVVAINKTGKGILILDKSKQRAYTDLPSLVLAPNRPTLVPRYLGDQLRPYISRGEIEIPDDQRGAPGEYIDASFSTDRAIARDGKPPEPTKQDLVEKYKAIVIDGSLADCVATCVLAGVPEDVALHDLVRVYDRSFLEPKNSPDRAFYQPWIRRSQELITLHRAKQAGVVDVPSATAPEGGE